MDNQDLMCNVQDASWITSLQQGLNSQRQKLADLNSRIDVIAQDPADLASQHRLETIIQDLEQILGRV